jgi:hypothetical protein
MGCRIILIALFVFVLLLGLAGAALFHYAGWYSLLIIPVVAVALYFFLRGSLIRLFMIPFQLKGKVLKGASATIHEVSFVGIEEVGKSQKEKQFAYLVDLTLKPSSVALTPFKMWDPYELCVVAPDAKASLNEDPTDGSFGNVVDVSVFENGRWQDEDFDKLHGEARIRLKLRLVKPCTACKLRYYFYDITKIELPPASEILRPTTVPDSDPPAQLNPS